MTKTRRKQRKRLWSLLRFTIFLLLVIISSVFALNKLIFKDETNNNVVVIPQGIITILNLDADTELPIKNSEFTITATESGEVVEVLYTNEEGKVISKPLDYNTHYSIIQTMAPEPYKISKEETRIEITVEDYQVVVKNNLYSHVKDTQRLEDGTIRITKVDMPVEVLMQNPELPNGCEITSLTAVLNYKGYGVSKTEMADKYLPKEPFVRKGDRLIGANPYKAFAGNPREISGFFVYAPPIVEATNHYLKHVNEDPRAKDVSGSTMKELLRYLDKGIPVVTWVTLDLSKPKLNYSWYLSDTGENFIAPINLHAVVLKGYDTKNVYYMDPLQGNLARSMVDFFQSYYELGMHAVIVAAN